jgi:hypothetical protein
VPFVCLSQARQKSLKQFMMVDEAGQTLCSGREEGNDEGKDCCADASAMKSWSREGSGVSDVRRMGEIIS